MNRIDNIKVSCDTTIDELKRIAAQSLGYRYEEVKTFRIIKKSIDARARNNIKIIYSVEISREIEPSPSIEYKVAFHKPTNRPIIIGAGPAGLFSGLILAKAGLNPIIYERGSNVDNRVIAVNDFMINRNLSENTNIQFGEGGAGAFSDGKLNTQIKSPFKEMILRIFFEFGAPEEILYNNKPHIGTDKLRGVVKSLRQEIERLGGRILFNKKVDEIIVNKDKVVGCRIGDEIVKSDIIILAIGHSARDTFNMLRQQGIMIEQKPFACGFRIEHLREKIDESQYGKFNKILPSADYKLVSHTPYNKSVFTFCMCPGGWVVPASSEKGGLVINGMSEFNRDNINSNSAILINVDSNDFKSDDALAGIEYQRMLEQKAYALGGSNYNAPVERVGDFLNGYCNKNFGEILPTYRPGVEYTRLDTFFTSKITQCFRYAIKDMAKRLRGFDNSDAILTAVESRSSSPVRVLRDETFQSVTHKGLYPVGEGCGYAGGIMSASIDGVKIANRIIDVINNY